jgi:glycosyltransferase involved in cell wall biosynthesis
VVVNTRNEEHSLPYALRSVASWADEIVLVDMESTDGTLAVARAFGARTFTVEPAGFADPARAFAVAQATGDWILVLDADELVPEPLSCRLLEIAAGDAADIVMCPYRTFILGAALKGSGWGPRYEVHPRFYRRGHLTWSPEVHRAPMPAPGSRIVTVEGGEAAAELAIHHFNYLGFGDFLDRLNRYTSIEAAEAAARGESVSLLRGFARAGRELLWRLVKDRGFRDGWRGVYLSTLMGVYRLVVSAKQHQLRTVGSEEEIEAGYVREAERLLAAYPEGAHRT